MYPEPVQKLNSPDRRKMSKMSYNDYPPVFFKQKNPPIDKVSFSSSSTTGSKINYLA